MRHALIGLFWIPFSVAFLARPSPRRATSAGFRNSNNRHQSSSSSNELEGPVLADIPSALKPLFASAANATTLRSAETSEQAHDAFRYEWGTWVNETSLEHLMEKVNEIRLNAGIYDKLVQDDETAPRRLLVASGQDWECILHVLPTGMDWSGRWPTGSWAVVKTLTGMAEINALTGPDRNGRYKTKTSKSLRGGGDGSLGGGRSSAGVDCIKYVGGPLRQYRGKSGKTVLLEVVVRPPSVAYEREEIEPLEDLDATFSVVIPQPEKEDEEPPKVEKTKRLENAMGMSFDEVGGLDKQLDSIARRVLASRANPEAARRLGVSHVRGILLSGPPGCGKTLLARELARLLGAREPQIVNGPEILDKYIGEAEKKVRELFAPAEQEFKEAGDDSALHIIILDEMDAIARKRGTMTSDTTGVRDSVVNQLLAKMDGVKQASNVLVVGLTNRPELLDPALLRPGRLEVQLRVELPDLEGRRDILRIHTRQMRESGALSPEASNLLEGIDEHGIAARTEHYSGAELAGLVRSAASFALARTVASSEKEGLVSVDDLERALSEVRPALGKQDEILKMRYPLGISPCSFSMKRIIRDLDRFVSPVNANTPRLNSLLLVGAGGNGGAGASALAAYAAKQASSIGTDYVRFITALDLLTSEDRASALAEQFAEAREMPHSLLVLDDVDQLCAGSGPNGYSSVMLATLRALLRSPPASSTIAKAGGHSETKSVSGKSIHVIAATSQSNAACTVLGDLFDETIVVPLLSETGAIKKLLLDGLPDLIVNVDSTADLMIEYLGEVGCKTALRLAERAAAVAGQANDSADLEKAQLSALAEILDDLSGDQVTAETLCEVI